MSSGSWGGGGDRPVHPSACKCNKSTLPKHPPQHQLTHARVQSQPELDHDDHRNRKPHHHAPRRENRLQNAPPLDRRLPDKHRVLPRRKPPTNRLRHPGPASSSGTSTTASSATPTKTTRASNSSKPTASTSSKRTSAAAMPATPSRATRTTQPSPTPRRRRASRMPATRPTSP
jgi:hypothetical protein